MKVVIWFACFVTVVVSAQLPGQTLVTPLGPFGGDVRSLAVHPENPTSSSWAPQMVRFM